MNAKVQTSPAWEMLAAITSSDLAVNFRPVWLNQYYFINVGKQL